MIFTHDGELYDSDIIERWMPPQDKTYIAILKDRITSLEFKLQQSLREIERLMIKEK